MKRSRIPIVVTALSIGLTGCGKHLGDYRLENVTVVDNYPDDGSDFDEIAKSAGRFPEFVRAEISSNYNFYTADTGAGLYTDADFCPISDRHRIIAFEPRASDFKAVESWKRNRPYMPSEKDGRYHYYVYLVSKSGNRKPFSNSPDQIAGYDLRTAKHSICFRFFVPGYNITPSVSSAIQITPETLSDAFAAHDKAITKQALTITPVAPSSPVAG